MGSSLSVSKIRSGLVLMADDDQPMYDARRPARTYLDLLADVVWLQLLQQLAPDLGPHSSSRCSAQQVRTMVAARTA
jgi:hypothetical protein